MIKNFFLLSFQMAFLSLTSRYGLIRGGLGAGKTFCICMWAIMRAIQYPGSPGLIAANSYKQLHKATLKTALGILTDLGIKFKHNKNEQVVYLENGSYWYLYSLENYDDLRGIEVAYAIVDELAYSHLLAWNTLIARVRTKGYGPNEIRAGSTPKGFNFMYDLFAGPDKSPQYQEVYANPRLNHHLPEGYLDGLKANYSPLYYKQEVLGEYVATNTGRQYYAFNKDVHVFDTEVPRLLSLPSAGGVDFNVHPLTANLGWLLNGSYTVREQIYLENSNTFALAESLLQSNLRPQILYPDAAGTQRKSSSTQTDHDILRNAGFELRFTAKNPPIKDRINTVNWLFANNKIRIHSSCKDLINDFDRLTWESDDLMMGHSADGFGYWAHFETPMPRLAESSQQWSF
jgi:hypothetical protein